MQELGYVDEVVVWMVSTGLSAVEEVLISKSYYFGTANDVVLPNKGVVGAADVS